MTERDENLELKSVLEAALEDWERARDSELTPEEDPSTPGWVIHGRQLLNA